MADAQGDGSIHRLDTLPEQVLVRVDASPTLAVERIRYVELCAGICPAPGLRCCQSSRAARNCSRRKSVESGIELFLVDLISAGGDLGTGRHFCEGAWLSGIDPDDERSVCERDSEARDLNDSGLAFSYSETN